MLRSPIAPTQKEDAFAFFKEFLPGYQYADIQKYPTKFHIVSYVGSAFSVTSHETPEGALQRLLLIHMDQTIHRKVYAIFYRGDIIPWEENYFDGGFEFILHFIEKVENQEFSRTASIQLNYMCSER